MSKPREFDFKIRDALTEGDVEYYNYRDPGAVVHVREVMPDDDGGKVSIDKPEYNNLLNCEVGLYRVTRALERAKACLVIYDKYDENADKSRIAQRYLKEIEAI